MQTLASKVLSAKNILREAFDEYHDYDWEVGFSGGKDSTVLLHLLVEVVQERLQKGEELPERLVVVYSDTLVEIPLVRKFALKTLSELEKYSAERLEGRIRVKVLRPLDGEDFLSMMIDKGYPAPHFRFRWCVKRLKTKPAKRLLEELGDRLVMVSGIRVEESVARNKYFRRRGHGEVKSIKRNGKFVMIAPLYNWTSQEVFEFLFGRRQPWSYESYRDLLNIYMIGEKTIPGDRHGVPVLRYGCWTCTVIQRDKTLEKLASTDAKWRVLLEAKEAIRHVSAEGMFRQIDENGRYRRLNELGRLAIIAVTAMVLAEFPEALSAYLEDLKLRKKLANWLYTLEKSPKKKEVLTAIGLDETVLSNALSRIAPIIKTQRK